MILTDGDDWLGASHYRTNATKAVMAITPLLFNYGFVANRASLLSCIRRKEPDFAPLDSPKGGCPYVMFFLP